MGGRDQPAIRRIIETKFMQTLLFEVGQQCSIGLEERWKARFTIDYRRLNDVTKKDAYSIQQIQAQYASRLIRNDCDALRASELSSDVSTDDGQCPEGAETYRIISR